MKKTIYTLLLTLVTCGLLKAQETPPALLKSVNSQFYIHLPDSTIWQQKGRAPDGSDYGWHRVAKYNDIYTYGNLNYVKLAGGNNSMKQTLIFNTNSPNTPDSLHNGLYFTKNTNYANVWFRAVGNTIFNKSDLLFDFGDDPSPGNSGGILQRYNRGGLGPIIDTAYEEIFRSNRQKFQYKKLDLLSSFNVGYGLAYANATDSTKGGRLRVDTNVLYTRYAKLFGGNTLTGLQYFNGGLSVAPGQTGEFNGRAIFRATNDYAGLSQLNRWSDGVTTNYWLNYWDGTDLNFEKQVGGVTLGKLLFTTGGNIKDHNGNFFLKQNPLTFNIGDSVNYKYFVTFGSSLTDAIFRYDVIDNAQTWRMIQSRSIGYVNVNMGRGGRTAQHISSADSSIYTQRANIPIARTGSYILFDALVNDIRNDTTIFTKEKWKLDMRDVVNTAVANGYTKSRIVIFNPSYYPESTLPNHGNVLYRYNQYKIAAKFFCDSIGVRFLDFWPVVKAQNDITHNLVGQDSVHNTVAGQAFIAARLKDSLNITPIFLAGIAEKVYGSKFVTGNETIYGDQLVKGNSTLDNVTVNYANIQSLALPGGGTKYIRDDGLPHTLVAADITAALTYTPFNPANYGSGINVTSNIARVAYMTGATSTKMYNIYMPAGGQFKSSSTTGTGAIEISLPTTASQSAHLVIEGTMMQGNLPNTAVKFTIGCHVGLMNVVYSATFNGPESYNVGFYTNGSSPKIYIYKTAGLASTWNTAGVTIDKVQVSSSDASINTYSTGFGIAFATSYTGSLAATVTAENARPLSNLNTVLAGYTIGTATAVTNSQTVYQALGNLQAQSDSKAPLASPALTGSPTAPTAAAGNNSTLLATTAFVQAALAKGVRLTGSGNGVLTTISIPHGLTGVTSASIAIVQPINAASAGISFITTDATNVNINYTAAPVNGTNNLSYNLMIKP